MGEAGRERIRAHGPVVGARGRHALRLKAQSRCSGTLRDIWHYRGFVRGSIRREIATQYRGSLLGAAWVLIGPPAMILIYTLVFSHLMRSRLAGVDSAFGYSIFLCAGLLPWTFFTESLTRLQAVFVANAQPDEEGDVPADLPAGDRARHRGVQFRRHRRRCSWSSCVVSGSFPGLVLFAALPALGVQVALAMGLGMLFATLNVFFRDVGQAVTLAAAVLVLADADRLSDRARCPTGRSRCSRGIR